MSRRTDDLLIVLALLGPLALVAFNRWSASLERWYIPWGEAYTDYFGDPFTRDVASWLPALDEQPALHVVIDRKCACTRPAMRALRQRLSVAGSGHVRLVVRDVNERGTSRDVRWQAVVRHLPATPAVLAVAARRLLYVGPVNAGGICSQRADVVPALSALQHPPTLPVYNWLAQGCYCPSQGKGGRRSESASETHATPAARQPALSG